MMHISMVAGVLGFWMGAATGAVVGMLLGPLYGLVRFLVMRSKERRPWYAVFHKQFTSSILRWIKGTPRPPELRDWRPNLFRKT